MVLSLDRWVGKVAVVTGASAGIGEAIAKQLAKEGLIVVGLARRSERIEALAKTIKGKLYGLKTDLTKEEDIVNAFKWITENVGPVHILINNAGVAFTSHLTDGKCEDWQTILNVNVLALSIATREAVQIMKKNNINGHIIHINSRAGHLIPNLPGLGVYAASKWAVTALTETLRQEFNHFKLRIKITSLSPGFTASEMTTNNPKLTKEMKDRLDKLPHMQPEDVADGVVYVLSTPEHVQVHELLLVPHGFTL